MSGGDERPAAKRRPSLRRALRYSLLDGCAYSLMAGGAESYLTAFAVHLGVPARQVGLLGSVPQLFGSAAQLATPHGVRAVRGLKRWVVILACLQALILAAHATIPWIPGPPFLPLLLLLVSYWTVNLAIAPAWNHWMALLVPASRRATYFARRNRVLHVCMLAGLALSGFFLQRSAEAGAAIRGFIIVVLLGGAMRLVSATFLALQDGPRHAVLERALSFPDFLASLRQGPGRILVFLWFMNFAVALSAPYSVPYLLSDLRLSYTSFMLVTGAAFLAKSLTTGVWGVLVRRIGARRSFLLASLLIIPSPALWVLTRSTHWLVVLQVLAGSAWAGFELCQFLLFYDLFPEKRLSDVWSYYSLVNGVVVVIGTVLGGVVLAHGLWPGDHFTGNPYHLVFVTSTSVRLLPLLTLPGAWRRAGLGLRDMRRSFVLVLRVIGLNPGRGSITWPLWLRAASRPRRSRRREKRAGRRETPGERGITPRK